MRHLFKLVWKRKRTNVLIMAEIFLSFLVVFFVTTGATAILSGWNEPLGFDWHDVKVIDAAPDSPSATDEKDDPRRETYDALLRELRSFPEVTAAAMSDTPPYGGSTTESLWKVDGRTMEVRVDSVTDGFAEVMRLKLLRGRWFKPSDDASALPGVVIDSDLAGNLFGPGDPLGRKIDTSHSSLRVIGVVAAYHKSGELYPGKINMAFVRKTLSRPDGPLPRQIVVRLRPGTPAEFEETLTRALHAISPDAPVRVHSMASMRSFILRFFLVPLAIAAILALFLIAMVTLGLTGVLWQTVNRRTRELGLRRALGATGSGVRHQVIIEVALLTTLAVAVGVVIILQLPLLGILKVVSPVAFGSSLVASLAVIYTITLSCGAYPAWLASSVEPADALRYE